MLVWLLLAIQTVAANGAITKTLTSGTFTDNSVTETAITLTISVGSAVTIRFPQLTRVSGTISIRMNNWNTIASIEFPKL
eukprot:m.299083 g.299083  ORF g.299083 m.299083 type:complete len:80 (-) comp100067_c0_seq1:526-765(-)